MRLGFFHSGDDRFGQTQTRTAIAERLQLPQIGGIGLVPRGLHRRRMLVRISLPFRDVVLLKGGNFVCQFVRTEHWPRLHQILPPVKSALNQLGRNDFGLLLRLF